MNLTLGDHSSWWVRLQVMWLKYILDFSSYTIHINSKLLFSPTIFHCLTLSLPVPCFFSYSHPLFITILNGFFLFLLVHVAPFSLGARCTIFIRCTLHHFH